MIRGVSPELNEEALRVINSMPVWSPGKQRGKAVNVKYTVPVTFRLSGGKKKHPLVSCRGRLKKSIRPVVSLR